MNAIANKPFRGPASDFPEGDRCQLEYWKAVVPDPDAPGKFRVVEYVLEARISILPGNVDAEGNPEA